MDDEPNKTAELELAHVRDELGRFKPGTVGGPGRRKLNPEAQALLERNEVAACQLYVDAMNNVALDMQTRLDAADRIMNRLRGRPVQATEGGALLPEGARIGIVILPPERSDDDGG